MKRYREMAVSLVLCCITLTNAWAYQAFWACSSHPCQVTAAGGSVIVFDKSKGVGYYHIYNSDYGATDMSVVESLAEWNSITAQDVDNLRFKGWFTALGGWDTEYPEVSLATSQLTDKNTITASEIAKGGVWGNRPTIIAKYVPIYEIQTTNAPPAGGSTEGAKTYEKGETVALNARANDGYLFSHWEKGGKLASRESSYTFKADAGCEGLYTAVFTGRVYKVSFGQAPGSGGTNSVYAQYGSALPKLDKLPEYYGWDFTGYYDKSEGEGNRYYDEKGVGVRTWDKPENATLYAAWTPKMCRLTLERSTGIAAICHRTGESSVWHTNTVTTSEQLPCGTRVHAYAIPLDGWSVDYGIESQWYREIPADGITFKPKATEIPRVHEVVFMSTNRVVDAVVRSVPEGTAAVPPAWKCSGYTLSWDKDFSSVTADMTVYAVWTPIPYVVRFEGNGAEGSMADVVTAYDQPVVLRNGFTHDTLFFDHWTTTVDQTQYPDGAVVSNLTTVAHATNTFHAVWTTHRYTIRFYGNGGTNIWDRMEDQAFVYGTPQALRKNTFMRTGYSFRGWALDPVEGDVVLTDGEDASRLTEDDGVIIALYARWEASVVGLDNPLSIAADCATNRADRMMLDLTGALWCDVNKDEPDVGGNGQSVMLNPFGENRAGTVTTSLIGSGSLTFSYRLKISDYIGTPTEDNEFEFILNGETLASVFTNCNEWAELSYRKESSGTELATWQFTARCNYDGDYALVDNIRWLPDEQDAGTVGVTFRTATGEVFSNVTCVAGTAIGALPVLTNELGQPCTWNYQSETITSAWLVPTVQDVELTPSWSGGHPVPTDADKVTVSSVAVVDGMFGLSFDGDARFDYQLQTNGNLTVSDGWAPMGDRKPGTKDMSFGPFAVEGIPQLFFKVETLQKQD